MSLDVLFLMVWWILFIVVFLVVVVFGLYRYRTMEERRHAFGRLAQELGFTTDDPLDGHTDQLYEIQGSERGKRIVRKIVALVIRLFGPGSPAQNELKAHLTNLRLFKGFSTIRIYNFMTKDTDRGKTYLFDGAFKRGSNRSYYRTALVVIDERLDFPECTLVPEDVSKKFHKLLGLFGLDHKDINVEFDPEFSSSFIIRGSDEYGVREILNTGVCRWFVSQREEKPHFESKGSKFVIYFEGEKFDIDKLRALYFSAMEFLEMWAR